MKSLLSAKELADRLGVPISWVYDRTRTGGPDSLPHYKMGKYVRFAESEVLEYLESTRVVASPQDDRDHFRP